MTGLDVIADISIEYATGLMSGHLLGDWEPFNTANDQLARALPAFIAGTSGAVDELEFYGETT